MKEIHFRGPANGLGSPLRCTAVLLASAALTAGCGGGSSGAGKSASSAQGTQATAATSAAYVSLFVPGSQPVEKLQYREADGTLVTMMGMRPVGRHAREPWDNTTGQEGLYYEYPAFYFQNRTYGIEIHDHVPAGGKSIEFYLRVNAGTFKGTTFSLFRNINNPDVTGYGWSLNTGFNNPNEGGEPICHAGQPLQDCMITVDSNWRTDPHSPLQIGDKIELAPAERLIEPVIDGGGARYYSFEQLYVVGKGLKPWYGIAPNLDSEPLPASTLLGGDTSVSYNYSSEPDRLFQQMANNIGIGDAQRFVEGRRLFHTSFVDGTHAEHSDKNPVFTAHIGQIGPRFNQVSCVSCHANDGRSPATADGGVLDRFSVLTGGAAADGSMVVDPVYGLNIQMHATDAKAADYGVTVHYDTTVRTLPDGDTVEMHTPSYAFRGPVPAHYSLRQAPQVIGLGLLEAVPETEILALADPNDSNGDGVHGVANFVKDPESGQMRLGRFGWKAAKSSLRHQAAEALIEDIGVTSPVYAVRDCQLAAADCKGATQSPAGVTETELQRLTQYLGLIGVPAQRSLRSGYPDGVFVPAVHDIDPARIDRGSKLFAQSRCAACHVTQMTTDDRHPLAELRNQTFHPYTDLLLHDMGPGLADTLTEGQAKPQMWRTQPLWGIGTLPYVQGGAANVRYLHDGRARSLTEAIEWHDGEAHASRLAFEALSRPEQQDLLAFLGSL